MSGEGVTAFGRLERLVPAGGDAEVTLRFAQGVSRPWAAWVRFPGASALGEPVFCVGESAEEVVGAAAAVIECRVSDVG